MKNKRNPFLVFLAFFFPVSEFLKQLILIYTGSWEVWHFPFHLCSMPIIFMPIVVFSKNAKVRQVSATFLADFSLVGGIAVFLDQSGLWHSLPILTVHSYLWHIFMIISAVILGRSNDFDAGGFLKAAALYFAMAATAQIPNTFLKKYGPINMFYVSPYQPMRQIVFRLLVPLLKNNGAIAVYMATTVFAAYGAHSIFSHIQKSQNSKKAK
jgi:hypothetical protein